MQAQIVTPLRTVPAVYTYKVSGGEVALKVTAAGAVSYWMNGRQIDKATMLRKRTARILRAA